MKTKIGFLVAIFIAFMVSTDSTSKYWIKFMWNHANWNCELKWFCLKKNSKKNEEQNIMKEMRTVSSSFEFYAIIQHWKWLRTATEWKEIWKKKRSEKVGFIGIMLLNSYFSFALFLIILSVFISSKRFNASFTLFLMIVVRGFVGMFWHTLCYRTSRTYDVSVVDLLAIDEERKETKRRNQMPSKNVNAQHFTLITLNRPLPSQRLNILCELMLA